MNTLDIFLLVIMAVLIISVSTFAFAVIAEMLYNRGGKTKELLDKLDKFLE